MIATALEGVPAGAPASAAPALALERASVARGGRAVWSDVTVSVAEAQFAAVLGPNGAGKSTLLDVILGLVRLSEGAATVLGRRPGQANRAIGYLPQTRALEQLARIRGVDLVRLGLDGVRWGVPLPSRLGGRRAAQREARVAEVIELVGAGPYARRPLGELSGGEQQRLLIAQALVAHPRLLMLDEPLDGLDLSNQGAIAALVQRICREEQVAVVLVAHDVNPILDYLDQVIYLARGAAVQGHPREVINSHTLSELYRAPIEVLETSDGRLVVVGQPEAPHVHGPRHAH